MRISWTNTALQNMEHIENFLFQENPYAAKKIIKKIIYSIEMLLEHPHAGRPGRIIGTRELIIIKTPYLVPYRIKEQHIQILRVFHGSMIWPENF